MSMVHWWQPCTGPSIIISNVHQGLVQTREHSLHTIHYGVNDVTLKIGWIIDAVPAYQRDSCDGN